MNWILPEEYENAERFERELQLERDEARQILIDSEFVERVIFTDCMIPLQIDAILPTGEMCYGRNSRVGGDVTMWVFEKECDLSKGWPPILFQAERASDATKYTILAREMIVLIREYIDQHNSSSALHP
jgi:hypothetical protein